jgi:LCP family protein required for cell wall assembly
VGGAIGFYYKPIAKLAAKVYLSVKVKKSHVQGTEGKKVANALKPISTDPNKSVNTLIMGSDAGSNKGEGGYCRSDVMMLVCLQERDKRAVVFSIPRDTMVQIPGYGTQKINAAHAFSGPSGAIAAVQSLLGVDVNHFISMQFDGFKKIVNALGGVPIHLNQAISDPHAGYLPAGDLLLDGEQALVVVRSRKLPNGDVDRIKSQQAFIKALMAKAESQKSVWKANQLVDIVTQNCKMDYSAGQLMDLAQELQGFQLDSVQFVTVPGDSKNIGGVSYFVADLPMTACQGLRRGDESGRTVEPPQRRRDQRPRRVEGVRLGGADGGAGAQADGTPEDLRGRQQGALCEDNGLFPKGSQRQLRGDVEGGARVSGSGRRTE